MFPHFRRKGEGRKGREGSDGEGSGGKKCLKGVGEREGEEGRRVGWAG